MSRRFSDRLKEIPLGEYAFQELKKDNVVDKPKVELKKILEKTMASSRKDWAVKLDYCLQDSHWIIPISDGLLESLSSVGENGA